MEEKKTECLRKTSTVRVPLEPLDCWNISKNEKNREFASVARVRTRLLSHELPPPIGDDKTILKIQKKLDALSSIQSSVKYMNKSPSDPSPPRQLSARRARGGVTYRPSNKTKSNIIEIPAKSPCIKCKTLWAGLTPKKTCELCPNPKFKYAFEVELKLIDNNKASLIIGTKEIAINLNNKFKTILALSIEDESTLEINLTQDWNELTRVATPSFHLNTDQDVSFTSNISFPANISFSEHTKRSELMTELDNLIKKQGKILESPSMNQIQEVCQDVCMDYSKLVKKISEALNNDFTGIIEKSFKGFAQFFDSCLISLIKYVCQLRESNLALKESEQMYVKKIAILNRLVKKNGTGCKSYSARNN